MKMNKIRKSVIAVLLCALVVSSLTACGSKKKDTAEPSAEPPAQQTDASGQESTVEEVNGAGQQDPQPQQAPAEAAGHSGTEYAAQDNVDLTGNWAQKDMEGSDSYVAGYISDGVVEIFLMSEKGSKGSLYWSGTYVPQTTPGTPYTWDSVNDRDRTGQAEIGSDSDTKTFSYENGELTLPVTMLGQTTVVTMVRSTQDYSVFAGNGGASFSAEDGQPVEIEDRVFTWFTMDDGTCLIYYEMTLKNPNPSSAIRNAVIQVTARGENESDLSTQERTVPMIAAGDTIMFGDAFSYQGPAPASVEMVAFNEPDAYVSQEASSAPSQSDLEVSNGLENVNETGTVYTGEVTNNTGKDLGNVRLSVIFRKGDDIVGGMGNIITTLANGETKPFEIMESNALPEHDSFEIVAHDWDPQTAGSGAQQDPAGQPSDPAAQPQPAGQPQPAAQPQPAGQ